MTKQGKPNCVVLRNKATGWGRLFWKKGGLKHYKIAQARHNDDGWVDQLTWIAGTGSMLQAFDVAAGEWRLSIRREGT